MDDYRARALKKLPPITKPQLEHIERLCNDVGFTRTSRNAWIGEEVGRPIRYLDELKKIEAQSLISALLQIRGY